jgi:lysophospholipase L1-like esterase
MKIILIGLSILAMLSLLNSNQKTNPTQEMRDRKLTYLALGDSYTIGEGVDELDRYPNQLVKRLSKETFFNWKDPKIIAKTGWTVDELNEGINNSDLSDQPFDLVTLLIGVNNQYRGRAVNVYKTEFETMLKRAIAFAGDKPDHVVVISIPDWGVTPFATSRGTDKVKVAGEIDAYNQAKKEVCDNYGVAFLDISKEYREIGAKPEMVVEDNLHPSGLVYTRWTDKLFKKVSSLTF